MPGEVTGDGVTQEGSRSLRGGDGSLCGVEAPCTLGQIGDDQHAHDAEYASAKSIHALHGDKPPRRGAESVKPAAKRERGEGEKEKRLASNAGGEPAAE